MDTDNSREQQSGALEFQPKCVLFQSELHPQRSVHISGNNLFKPLKVPMFIKLNLKYSPDHIKKTGPLKKQ